MIKYSKWKTLILSSIKPMWSCFGANDVVNPAAKTPEVHLWNANIEVFKAQSVIVNKRSMASGYAGLDNELFYMDSTMMVFGDAKKIN